MLPAVQSIINRQWKRILLIGIPFLVAGVAGAMFWLQRAPAPRLPIRNVVLISLDTCRADHLGCYGYSRPTTPNMDRVAADGMRFEQVISPIPLTLPAHSSLLTGTLPPSHGVRDNFDYRLSPSQITLAEILKENGFTTGAIIGAFPLDAQFGLDQGFDTYHDQFEEEHLAINVSERKGEEVSRLAGDYLTEHADEPFFLFLHYFDPHAEYVPPEPFASTFADEPYAGEIAYTDFCVGQVVDRLKELDLYDSTLLMIVGDHGEMLGEHGEIGHGFFVYGSAVRVPWIVRLPGQRRTGASPVLAGLIDVVPTVCELLGITPPPQVQGVSLAAQLGPRPPDPIDRALYIESLTPAKIGANPLRGLVTPRWKFIQTSRPELYDLAADPEESTNLAAGRPRVVDQFEQALTALLAQWTRMDDEDSRLQLDARAQARLRGLGYVGGSVAAPSGIDPGKPDPKDMIQFHVASQRVVSLIAGQQYQEAGRLLDRLVREQPDLPSLHLNRAQIATLQGEFPVAESHLNRALELDPNQAEAHNNLGAALASQGRFAQAVPHFREAIRLQPHYPEAHANWAGALAAQGQFDESVVHYREALELQPDYVKCRVGLGAVRLAQGKPGEAIESFRQALRAQPDAPDVHFQLGRALAQTGDMDAALTHTREAVRLGPDQPAYLHHLSWMLTAHPNPASRNTEQAVQYSQRAAELTQFQDPGVLDGLATAYAATRQFDRALETARAALALTTNDPTGPVATRIRERLDHYQRALR